MFLAAVNRRRFGPAATRNYYDLVLADNPIAYWPVQDASGTTADDIIGSLDGTYGGTYTLADRIIRQGGAAATKFTAGYFSVSSGTSLDRVNGVPWSCEGWFRVNSGAGGSARANIYNNLVNSGLGYTNAALYLTPSGGNWYLTGGWTDAGTNIITVIQDPNPVSLDTDYLGTLAFDGTTRYLMRNGVIVASGNSAVASPATSSGTFVGGDALNPGSYKFPGHLSDVVVYSTCVQAARALARYNLGHI